MNPLKANKVLFGADALAPYIESDGNTLSFYDSQTGAKDLRTISNTSSPVIKRVGKTLEGADFTSIQEAIDALDEGIVYVYWGTYEETLNITKNISLIGVGATLVSAGTCVTCTDADLNIQGIKFICQGAGAPACISFTSASETNILNVSNCEFDTTANNNADFISVNGGMVTVYAKDFVGEGGIQITDSELTKISGYYLPNLTFTNCITARVLAGYVESLDVINSRVYLNSDYGSVIGDINSQVSTTKGLRGSETFVNEASRNVVLPCPLSSVDYSVFVETATDGSVAVVSNKTTEGFTITYGAAKNFVVSWYLTGG